MNQTPKCVAIAGLLLGLASTAMASPWAQASGTGAFFTWANGQNQTDLFGSPTLVGGTRFVFFPSAFTANATNGQTSSASDQFDVDLHSLAGYKFTEIRIETFGDYTIQGTGSVAASGALNIHELASSRSTTDSLLTNPAFPVFSGTNVDWTGSATRDLTLVEGGVPFTDIHISFSNNLLAISGGAGSSATINKTVVGFPVAVTIIPEPGVLALLGIGGLVALRRKR